jgi:hypothetical protein
MPLRFSFRFVGVVNNSSKAGLAGSLSEIARLISSTMFRERFPFSQEGVPPLAESVVEGVGRKPDLSHASWIDE